MNSLQKTLFGLLLVLALLVAYLAWRNPQPPLLPADEAHARFSGPEACMACHGPEGALPQSRNHPVGRDCLRCHGSL